MQTKTRCAATSFLLCLTILLAGCSSSSNLMPTPNLYADGLRDPFPDVPPELQNNKVEVLYLTDRKPDKDSTPDHATYGFGRSRSIAMGVSTLEIGKDVSWSDLNAASRTNERKVTLPLSLAQTRELVRFPPTPKMLIDLPTPTERTTQPATTSPSTLRAEIDAATNRCRAELSARLAKTPVKDVYVFVHGYDNTFKDAVETIGQLWHFMGRQGVPVAYTWPAGRGGLRGYTYDRESSEFTVYHLKEMLRVIASCPDVHKVHIISHSRGTDVAISALRELHLEFTGAGKSTREELKLKTLILAAPDLDIEVVIQRMVTVHLGRVPEQCVIYVCSKDDALGISNWLFGGSSRLGKIRGDMLTTEELETMRKVKSVQLVDCRISNPGPFGHSYFHANPAVSSDLILLVRYGLYPSPERPLNADPKGFWYLTDDYPKYARVPTTAPAAETTTISLP